MCRIDIPIMSRATDATRRSVGEGCYHRSPPDKPYVLVSQHTALIYLTLREGRGFDTESPLA